MDKIEISTEMTWAQFGAQCLGFAKTGGNAVCKAMRSRATRAFAAAQAMQEILPTLTDAQRDQVTRAMGAALSKRH